MQIGPTTALLQAISEVAAGTAAKRAIAAAPAKAAASATKTPSVHFANPPADDPAGAPDRNLPRGSLVDISV